MKLGMQVGLSPVYIVLDGSTAPQIFGPYLLRPNGYMDQDATWYGGSPQPSGLVLDGDPYPLPKKGRSPQIFGPCLLWPNGWIEQQGTWHGGSRQPGRLCVRWGPSPSPQKVSEPPPQLSAHFYCGQTAGCIKMPLDMEVGLTSGTLC